MTQRYIAVEDIASRWMADRKFREAYEALEDDFALAAALIRARGDANLSQEQLAAAMGTSKAFVARLEGGGSRPSMRTLERFAEATHTKLRIRFEPNRKSPIAEGRD